MVCTECGHMIAKHDNSGCIVGSCECMKISDEITGSFSFPTLPPGVRFTKRGHIKDYDLDAEALFAKVLQVIDSLGSFVGYELEGPTYLKGLSMPFVGKIKQFVSLDFSAQKAPDYTFEVEVEVTQQNSGEQMSSELLLRFHQPSGNQLPVAGTFSDLSGAKAARSFFHNQAIEFFGKLDAPEYRSLSSQNPPPMHESLHIKDMKNRYQFATKKRQMLMIISIASILIIILYRILT